MDLAEYEAKLLVFKNNVEKNIDPLDIRSVKYAEDKVSKIIKSFGQLESEVTDLVESDPRTGDQFSIKEDPKMMIIKNLVGKCI